MNIIFKNQKKIRIKADQK